MSKRTMRCPHKDKVSDCAECMAILNPRNTAEAKIREILENYTVDEATKQLKGLLVDARIQTAQHIQNTMVSPTGGYCDEISPDAIPNYIIALQQTRQEEVRE